jgi:hypothetical protein
MNRHSLLLILGAGASRPYGFPTGKDLVEKVQATLLEKAFADISLQLGIYDSQFADFRTDLQMSGSASIDAFLENNPKYVNVGKLVIAFFLLKYESHEYLYDKDIKDNWYQYVVDMMRRNFPLASIESNRLSFITYNYDRSLEFYLFNALRKSDQSITDEQCVNKMQHFPIVHLHGSLGSPKYLDGQGGKPYQPDTKVKQLLASSGDIHIISEQVEKYPEFRNAYQLIAMADHIVFLGFGYNPTNVLRLRLDSVSKKDATFWGSSLGFTESEKMHLIMNQPAFVRGINLQTVNSLDFLRNHVDLLV